MAGRGVAEDATDGVVVGAGLPPLHAVPIVANTRRVTQVALRFMTRQCKGKEVDVKDYSLVTPAIRELQMENTLQA